MLGVLCVPGQRRMPDLRGVARARALIGDVSAFSASTSVLGGPLFAALL